MKKLTAGEALLADEGRWTNADQVSQVHPKSVFHAEDHDSICGMQEWELTLAHEAFSSHASRDGAACGLPLQGQ